MAGLPGGAMLQQVKWKLTRSLYGIVGRDPPARMQAEAAPRPKRTVRFLGEDVERAELIKLALRALLALAVIFGIWFLSTTSEQTQLKAGSIVVLLITSFMLLGVVALFVYWWYETRRGILSAIGLGLLATFYIYFLVASIFFVIDEFFATNFGRSWLDFKIPQPLQEPFTAALGALFILASLYYFGIIVTKGGWAERADHFKAFVAWFLCGIFLLVTSKALDPLVGTNLGNSLRVHFGHWDQHAKLIVDLGAIALATVAALVFPFKKN
jgi:hypothetical protein